MAAALYLLLIGGAFLVSAIGLIVAAILTGRRVPDPVTQLAIAMFTSLAGALCLAESVLHGLDDYFYNASIIWLSAELMLLAIPPVVMFLRVLTPARIAVSVGLLGVAAAAAFFLIAATGIDRMIAGPLVQANRSHNMYWAPTNSSYWDHRIRTDVFNSIAPLPAIILYWVFWLATVGRLSVTRRSLSVLIAAVVGAATVALAAWLLWFWFTYVPSSAASPVLTLQAALVLAIWRILVVIGRRSARMAPMARLPAPAGG